MADYHSPTVVQPNISAADITPLERLILDLVFDADNEEGGVTYHSWCGPSDVITLSVADLRIACDASRQQHESSIGRHVAALLGHDRRDRVVTTAFTCTKMRPDGFGGSVMLITEDAIRYRSTTDILEEFWNEAAKASGEGA